MGHQAARTHTVVAFIGAIVPPTAVDYHSTVTNYYATAIRCLQSRGNFPQRILGHVLDVIERIDCTGLTYLFV